ncbi:hypothetical protein JW916_10355 [Candidatus Sumerlaeota bacterium]|nr:hypothetical protein [Candidatus Sumerlaeota bacterium]
MPLALCAAQLDLDIWYDEAFTLILFVGKGFRTIATDYSSPNNHLFYLMVLRPIYLLSDSNVALRLPSFFFASGTLLLVWNTLRRHVSPGAGVLGLLWLGLSQVFLNHAMQLRGYGLSMLMAAALADLALRTEKDDRRILRIANVPILAGFLYTLPSNVLMAVPLAGAAVVFRLGAERPLRAAARTCATWAIGAALAALFYLPIYRQLLSAIPARSGGRTAWDYFADGVGLVTRDAPWLCWGTLLGLPFWILRIRRDGKKGTQRFVFPAVLLLCIGGPFLLVWVFGVSGLYSRNFTPLLPLLALAAGWLLWEALEGVRRFLPRSFPDWAVTTAGIVLLWAAFLPRLLTYPARLSEYREKTFAQDGYYNYYSANFHVTPIVEYMKETLAPGERYKILFDRSGYANLMFCFERGGLPMSNLDFSDRDQCVATLYYIAPALANFEDLSGMCGLPPSVLQQFPIVRDFGYYKLHRSPIPVYFHKEPLDLRATDRATP